MNYKSILEAIKRRGAVSVTVNEALNGIEYRDKPFVVIRHDLDTIEGIKGFEGKVDLCLPNAKKMIEAETEAGIVSSLYVMAKRYYKENPLSYLVSIHHEIGYHACSENVQETFANMDEYSELEFKTIVPHAGNMTICTQPEIKARLKPLLSPDFQCQNDGYIADNGGHFLLLKSLVDGKAEWAEVDLIKFIDDMEDGKVYHFSFHPIWWDENLDFIGYGGVMRKISAAMIVGDVFGCTDPKTLLEQFEKCLESIKTAVDEIVVVWTDTNEDIPKIAEKHGAKVFKHEYTRDTWNFAEARNIAIEHTTCLPEDWIFIIDTDEYLDQADIPRMRIVSNNDQHDSIQFHVHSYLPTGVSMVNAIRMFRRSVAGYKDLVHNQPTFEGMSVITNVRIHHDGYNLTDEEMELKWKRTESLLLRQLDEQPDFFFGWMNLVRIYRCQKRYDDLLKVCEQILLLNDVWDDGKGDCAWAGLMIDWLFTLNITDKHKEAINIGTQLIEKVPLTLDAYQYLAGSYLALEQYDKAEECYKKHIELCEQYQKGELFSKSTMDTFGAIDQSWNNYGTALVGKKEYKKALDCYEKAIATGGKKEMYVKNLQIVQQLLSQPIPMKPKDDKLRILMVQHLTCIRNIKMTRALRKLGHHVDLAYISHKPSDFYKIDNGMYENLYQINNYLQLQQLAKNYDIVHSHNEPDLLSVALIGHCKLIHDTHDPIALRGIDKDQYTTELFEMLANTGANGRIYVSDLMMDYAKQRYNIDLANSLSLTNYVSEDDIPKSNEFKPKLSSVDNEFHIVYEGGIGSAHRDYVDLFKALTDAKIHVHVYPTVKIPEGTLYRELEANNKSYFHIYDPISPPNIIKEMTQYDAGIVAFNITEQNKAFLDVAVANKFYEYLAAGLPLICCDTASLKVELERLQCGIIYQTADDIITNIDKIKAIDVSNIPPFTMESQMPKLIEFYHKIIGNPEGMTQIDPIEVGQQFLLQLNMAEYKQNVTTKPDMNTRCVEYAFVFDMLNTIEPKEIIDVGTGTSALPALVQHAGFTIHAIDNIKDYWKQGIINRHWLVQPVDIMNPKEIQGKVDVITCVSVLEHIAEPDLAIKNMFKLLNVGGHLLLTFPYNEIDYIENVYKLPDAGYGQNYPYPCHVFNRDSADRWCIDNDATLVEERLYECFTGQYWTMGEKIKPQLLEHFGNAHLACFCIRKDGEIITRDDQLTEEKIKPDYSYQVYHNEIAWDEPTRKNIQKRIDRIVELSTGKILDIGCSDGAISILCGQAGKKVVGVDMLQEHIDRAKANLEKTDNNTKRNVFFRQMWAENLEYFDETYDTAILGEVLEHVVDADIVLSEIKRVLKPDGLALISVPIGENAVRSHKRFFEKDTLIETLKPYFNVLDIQEFGTQMLAICRKG